MRPSLRIKAVQITVCLIFFSASSDASCLNLSNLGYDVDLMASAIQCRDLGGAWILDCCVPCFSNSMARGLIIVGNAIFSRFQDALSFDFTFPPTMLQLLPGVYTQGGNCRSTVTYDSVQIIGVCGSKFTTIDCNRSEFHFKLTGRNVTIQGLTLVNGFSVEDGGCISIRPPASGINLVESFLLNCISYQNGGAISLGNADLLPISPSVSISLAGGCRIVNCSAKKNGGAMYIMVASRCKQVSSSVMLHLTDGDVVISLATPGKSATARTPRTV
jgi:hypothetical protein